MVTAILGDFSTKLAIKKKIMFLFFEDATKFLGSVIWGSSLGKFLGEAHLGSSLGNFQGSFYQKN
jgi:hypothetical protein